MGEKSVSESLAKNLNYAFLDPKTQMPPEMIFKPESVISEKQVYNWLYDTVKENEHCLFSFGIKETKGHVVYLFKDNKNLHIYDAQAGIVEANNEKSVISYLADIQVINKKYGIKQIMQLLKIDNLQLNPDIVDYVLESAE